MTFAKNSRCGISSSEKAWHLFPIETVYFLAKNLRYRTLQAPLRGDPGEQEGPPTNTGSLFSLTGSNKCYILLFKEKYPFIKKKTM